MTHKPSQASKAQEQDIYDLIGKMLVEVQNEGGKIPGCFFPIGDDDMDFLRCARRRIELRNKIGFAFTVANLSDEILNGHKPRSRSNKLNSISIQLGRVIDSFEKDDGLERRILQHADKLPPIDFLEILETLRRAVVKTSSALAAPQAFESSSRTLQERIINELAKVYESEFGLSAQLGVKRPWNDYQGPFVAFLQSCFELDGRPRLSPSAITKALQRYMPDIPRDSV